MIKNLKLNFNTLNKLLATGFVISFIIIGVTNKDNNNNDTNSVKVDFISDIKPVDIDYKPSGYEFNNNIEFISPIEPVDINSKTDHDLHKTKNIPSNKELKGYSYDDEMFDVTKKHVVKDNETIYDICMKYYASPVLMADLLIFNNLDGIKAGDILDIPVPSKLTSDENLLSITKTMQERELIFDINEDEDDIFSEFDYVVQEGDSFASLANKFYGNVVYSYDIMRFNGIKSLNVGDVIKIAPLDELRKAYEDNNTWNVKR